MKKKLEERAIALGFITKMEQQAFEIGYSNGQKDTFDEVISSIKENYEPKRNESMDDVDFDEDKEVGGRNA